jgi:hypothetical protein
MRHTSIMSVLWEEKAYLTAHPKGELTGRISGCSTPCGSFTPCNRSVTKRSYIFGGTRILARLTESLIMHSQERFPVIYHAVPCTSGNDQVNYMHLMFTVPLSSNEAAEFLSVNIIERETTPLTELLPPIS